MLQLDLAWPLPRYPVSWPGVTMWARKWGEEEAVSSSHWGDWEFGAQYLLGCTGSHQLFPGLLAKHCGAGTLTVCRAASVTGWDAGAGWVVGSQYRASGEGLSEL